MGREWDDANINYLWDELHSARNMIDLALLALENEEDSLVPTAIETVYQQLQGLVNEYCVVGE